MRLEPKGTGVVEIYSDEAGAVGATLSGFTESASVAVADAVFVISGDGHDDGASEQEYGRIDFVIDDATAGAALGSVRVYHCRCRWWIFSSRIDRYP